jgi:ABC-type Fe2+-enterobactin transport system substrate-binding protein
MDMSFARRRKVSKDASTPDLSVLLAEMSAKQGSSRTALVQSHPQFPVSGAVTATDPVIAIFAPVGQSVATTHRFSDQIANPVIPRKLT